MFFFNKNFIRVTCSSSSVPMDPGPCMLPPCVICGDRSSGYHYGANTCEACKVSIDINKSHYNNPHQL